MIKLNKSTILLKDKLKSTVVLQEMVASDYLTRTGFNKNFNVNLPNDYEILTETF